MNWGKKSNSGSDYILRGKLRQVRGVFKEKWARITNNERGLIDGKIDQAIGLLQENYGYSVDRAWQVFHEYVLDRDGLGSSLIQKTNQQIQDLAGASRKKRRRRTPIWLWILVGVGAVVLAGRMMNDAQSRISRLTTKQNSATAGGVT